jgi:hypothetical protein
MSPELLEAHQLGTKDSRPTKESDCYALGMVIYEVLSGQAPFAPYKDFIVMRKVIEGERPERPEGVKGEWFVGDLWETLEMCWAAEPESRPSIQAVFECLEQVPRDWKPSSPQADEDVEVDEDEDYNSNSSDRITENPLHLQFSTRSAVLIVTCFIPLIIGIVRQVYIVDADLEIHTRLTIFQPPAQCRAASTEMI